MTRPPVSVRGAISACERAGAQAGAEILAEGGNAADAAIAASFAQCVADPWRCSIGGGAHILYYSERDDRAVAIDASGQVPKAATSTMFKFIGLRDNVFLVEDDSNRLGYRAQLIPGFVRGMDALYREHGSGRLSWFGLIQPARRLAIEGFAVHPQLYSSWTTNSTGDSLSTSRSQIFEATEDVRRIFLHGDGSLYEIGERLVQLDLGETLDSLASLGADEFYRGSIAKRMHDDFRENAGLLTFEDLEGFRPVNRRPVSTRYRELDLITEPAPSVGPVLLAALEVLRDCGVARLSEGDKADVIIRGLAAAFSRWDALTTEPGAKSESATAPEAVRAELQGKRDGLSLVARSFARNGAETQSGFSSDDGKGWSGTVDRSERSWTVGPASETTHVAVIDGEGNACGITHTVGFATGVITPGLGFMHNCLMLNLDPRPGRPHSIEPGRTGPCGGGPVIGKRDGRAVLSMGSPAGPFKVSAMVQVLVDVLDGGRDLQSAISAPRIHVPASNKVLVEPRSPVELTLDLARRGYKIEISEYGARIAAVSRNLHESGYVACIDPRSDQGAAVIGGAMESKDNREEAVSG